MTSKYLIIADDFTGANDTGVQMKNRGIAVDVTLYPQKKKINSSVVLDTESRNLSANDATIGDKKIRIIKLIPPPINEYNVPIRMARPPSPLKAMGYPSKVVATEAGVPGILNNIAVIKPPDILPI